MKIVHICTEKDGGAGIAAFRIHEALNNIDFIDSYFLQSSINDDLNKKLYKVKKINNNIFFRVLRKFKFLKHPDFELKKNQLYKNKNFEIITFPESNYRVEDHPLLMDADIIHLHWISDFINYPTFFNKIKKPIIWTLHDMNPFQGIFHYKQDEINNEPVLGEINKNILFAKIQALKHNNNINIITLCKWMHDESKKSEIFNRYNHHIIQNLINFEKYPILNRTIEKNKLKINNGNKTLMFIAQDINNQRKGFDLLLKSLDKIKNNLNIITIGGQKINLNSNYNHLHFNNIKQISELNSIYSASDIVIISSREDNLPNVMLEAMANGTPVLSFNIGGMKDWIIENETGILIDPFNIEQFNLKLNKFINNEIEFSNEFIYSYSKNNFDIESNINLYVNLYKEIISNNE